MAENPCPPAITYERGGHKVENLLWTAWQEGYSAGYLESMAAQVEGKAPGKNDDDPPKK